MQCINPMQSASPTTDTGQGPVLIQIRTKIKTAKSTGKDIKRKIRKDNYNSIRMKPYNTLNAIILK